jgi:hypothetical protein
MAKLAKDCHSSQGKACAAKSNNVSLSSGGTTESSSILDPQPQRFRQKIDKSQINNNFFI